VVISHTAPTFKNMSEKFRTIQIPIHEDEVGFPVSLVHIQLSSGRFVTIYGPLAPKTMGALIKTIHACKDILVRPTANQSDFEI
jgi:hypothetical protein